MKIALNTGKCSKPSNPALQPKPAAPLVVEEFTAPSTYLDGIYTAEAIGFEGQITVQVTVAEDKITDITILSAEDEEEYLSRAKQVIPAILEGQAMSAELAGKLDRALAAYESIATSLGDAANNGYFQAKIAELKARMAS